MPTAGLGKSAEKYSLIGPSIYEFGLQFRVICQSSKRGEDQLGVKASTTSIKTDGKWALTSRDDLWHHSERRIVNRLVAKVFQCTQNACLTRA